jgi:hypothetical protein
VASMEGRIHIELPKLERYIVVRLMVG